MSERGKEYGRAGFATIKEATDDARNTITAEDFVILKKSKHPHPSVHDDKPYGWFWTPSGVNPSHIQRMVIERRSENMVLIADIKLVEVPNNPERVMEIIHAQDMGMMPPITAINATDPVEDRFTITHEMIQGRRFRLRDGREIVLGASKAVEEALGLPFQCLENGQREIDKLSELNWILAKDRDDWRSIVNYFRDLPWWKRVLMASRNEL